MTLAIRRGAERGKASFGWLESRHTFSFGQYRDPRFTGFGPLLVLNEDWVQPGAGFPPHRHDNMEILSYVLDGALEHADSTGRRCVIRPGDVQRMTAGTGVRHSEYNASSDSPVHFLQIWIAPDRRGLAPGHEQQSFALGERAGALVLIASSDGRDGSLTVHQDVTVFATRLVAGQAIVRQVAAGRGAWVHVARGALTVNGTVLAAGDAAALHGADELHLEQAHVAEVLLFDLPL